MSDFSALHMVAPGLIIITTASLCAGVGQVSKVTSGYSSVTGTWPTANQAIFSPFIIEVAWTPQRVAWENGATVTGNMDAGIYDISGARLINLGSTAQSGVSTIQIGTLTSPPTLNPGLYFMAMAASSASSTLRSTFGTGQIAIARMAGLQVMATAMALPTTATFANPSTAGFSPWLAFSGITTM